jgi:sugar lactone lactonase YvrE
MCFRIALGIVVTFISIAVAFGQRTESPPIRSIGDGGPATKAALYEPTGLAIDGKYLYIVESGAKRLRRVDLDIGIITTLAGGGKDCPKSDEESGPKPDCFDYPQRVAVDSLGNAYVTDVGIKGSIVKIAVKAHFWSVITAGTVRLMPDHSPERTAKLEWPAGIAISPSRGLFFDDYIGHIVFRMTPSEERLRVVAGTGSEGYKGDGGPAREGQLRFPDGLTIDAEGNIFIADSGNCRIQRVDSKTGIVTTITGTEEGGATCERLSDDGATMGKPSDVAVNQNGDVYFVLPYRQRVQRFDPKSGAITTVAGNGEEGFTGDGGVATQARLHFPKGIALDRAGNLLISDSYNGRIRRVDAKTRIITTVAGNGPLLHDVVL